jgi:Fibronectin type III domain
VYFLYVRVIVWALLVVLALIILPIAVLVVAGLIRRFQIARTRRELQRMGFVVSLPYERETSPTWPRVGIALAGLVAFGIATALLPGGPWSRTLASTAGSSPPPAPTHASVVPPDTNPGSEHPPSEEPTAHGGGSPPASPTSSAPSSEPGSDAGAPSTVTALPTSSTAIQLRWAPVTGAARYDVERSSDTVSWKPVGHTNGTQNRYTDAKLNSGTTYYYRVAALVGGDDVFRSDVVSATTHVETPTAPVLISATGSSTSVELAWSDVNGELWYEIQRSPDGTSGWAQIGTTGEGVTSYIDTGLESATTYYYRVVAATSDTESSPSTMLPATTDPAGPPTSEPNTASSEALTGP